MISSWTHLRDVEAGGWGRGCGDAINASSVFFAHLQGQFLSLNVTAQRCGSGGVEKAARGRRQPPRVDIGPGNG